MPTAVSASPNVPSSAVAVANLSPTWAQLEVEPTEAAAATAPRRSTRAMAIATGVPPGGWPLTSATGNPDRPPTSQYAASTPYRSDQTRTARPTHSGHLRRNPTTTSVGLGRPVADPSLE